MRHYFKNFLAVCCLMLILPSLCQAINVTASPSPATPLTANVNVSYNAGDCFNLTVAFGDGITFNIVPSGPAPINANTSHTYATAGTYTVTASGIGGICPAPLTAVTTVTVGQTMTLVSPTTLPTGTLSASYSYQLQTTGGQLPLRYSLFSGTLPPGLSLSTSGLLSGTPTSFGTSSFWVQVRDFNNQTTQKAFSLTISAPSVTGPSSMTTTVPRGTTSVRTIPYQFTASSPANMPLVSNGGVFLAGGTVLESNNVPLIVQLQNGRGQASETITVSPSVIDRALNQRVNTFVYQRTFSLDSSAKVRTYAQSQVVLTTSLTLNVATEATTAFDIKNIQLYFDNRKIDVTVDRNYPKLKAYVDILPLGSGLLQGNWTVDGRIIGNVIQPVTSGQLLKLQTPDIPPLPTFEVGTHLLRFNVTNPVTAVPMPTVLYYVNPTESKLALARLTLVSPGGGSLHKFSPLTFQWEGLNNLPLYIIEFFNDEKEMSPLFSAFTKKSVYSLPPNGFSKYFETGSTYYWKVTALNEGKNPIAESERRKFSFRK
jgi:hypothetical protein